MARLPTIKSDAEVAQNMGVDFQQKAGVTHWGTDSIGRVVTEVVVNNRGRDHAEYRNVFSSLQLLSAEGKALDDIGAQWGDVRRISATHCTVEATHRNLYFYVTDGTFGDINSGADITLPAGTIVRVRPGSGVNVIEYRLTANYTLPAEDSLTYVSAAAVTMGKAMNVGENVLRYHDFENYTEADKNLLKCNNDYPIINGANREEDDKFRYRIFQQIPSLVQNNQARIRLVGLEIPGVEQVRVVPGYYGIGSAAIIVFGVDGETTFAITESMHQRLQELQGPGSRLVAVAGVKVYLDFEVRVLLSQKTNVAEQQALTKSIQETIRTFLKKQEYSRTVNFAPVASAIVQEHTVITGLIGHDKSVPSFEHVYIRRTPADTLALEERRLLLNQSISLDDEEHIGLGRVSVTYQTEA